MRHEISLALIVCGTLLVLAPPISDYVGRRQVAEMLVERSDFSRVTFGVAPMSSEYRFGCWALGAAMVGIGVVTSLRSSGKGDGDAFAS